MAFVRTGVVFFLPLGDAFEAKVSLTGFTLDWILQDAETNAADKVLAETF